MRIFISTANQYMSLLKPFGWLFNRFWDIRRDSSVTVLGYDMPDFDLPKNFEFVSMGEQVGGIKAWSTDLRKYFESIDDKFFMWATEDMFLTSNVDHYMLNHIEKYYLTDDLGRFGLTNDNKGRPHKVIEYPHEHYQIIENFQNVNYRLSVLWSIWNREYLLKYLKPGLSPWEFEMMGSDEARDDGYKILGCLESYPIHQCLAVRKRNLVEPLNFKAINNGKGLDPVFIEEMQKEGIINEENRISVRND